MSSVFNDQDEGWDEIWDEPEPEPELVEEQQGLQFEETQEVDGVSRELTVTAGGLYIYKEEHHALVDGHHSVRQDQPEPEPPTKLLYATIDPDRDRGNGPGLYLPNPNYRPQRVKMNAATMMKIRVIE